MKKNRVLKSRDTAPLKGILITKCRFMPAKSKFWEGQKLQTAIFSILNRAFMKFFSELMKETTRQRRHTTYDIQTIFLFFSKNKLPHCSSLILTGFLSIFSKTIFHMKYTCVCTVYCSIVRKCSRSYFTA